jgi:hypothetical protein
MDIATPSPEMSAAIVLGGLAVLLGIANSIVSIFGTLRRRPPIDQELINYVRHPELLSAKAELKAELAQLREASNKTFSEAFTRMATLQSATEKTFQDVQHMVGRIEGRLDRCPSVCPPPTGSFARPRQD